MSSTNISIYILVYRTDRWVDAPVKEIQMVPHMYLSVLEPTDRPTGRLTYRPLKKRELHTVKHCPTYHTYPNTSGPTDHES